MTEIVKIPKTAFARVSRLGGSRLGAEIASNAAFIGSVLLAEGIMPHQLSSVKSFVATHVVKPYLSYFDGLADAFPALEGNENADQRRMMDEDERADLVASTLVDYSIKFSASFAAKAMSMKLFDRMAGLPALEKHKWYKDAHFLSTSVDHAAQVGAFLLMNTAGKSVNEDMQKNFASMLEKKFNMSHEHATTFARDAVNFQLINLIGFGAGTAYLDKHYRELFDKLGAQGLTRT